MMGSARGIALAMSAVPRSSNIGVPLSAFIQHR